MEHLALYEKVIEDFLRLRDKGQAIDPEILLEEMRKVEEDVEDTLLEAILQELKERGCAFLGDVQFDKSPSPDLSNFEVALEANPDMSSYRLLLKDLAKHPLLTQTEELALAKKAEGGDQEARDKLVTSNLRLVLAIAKRYRRSNIEMEDLVSEGFLGLIRATESFDTERKVRFSTYAGYWIKQRIQRYISEKSRPIRLPQQVRDNLNRLRKIMNQFEIEHERHATEGELAVRLCTDKENIRYLLALAELYDKSLPSLDSSIGEEEDSILQDVLSDPSANVESEVLAGASLDNITALLLRLEERERSILQMRYGFSGEEPLTLEEVAKREGITKERVRQIEQRGLAKIRRILISKGYSPLHEQL